MATYNKYYKEENYFGHPYPYLVEFFKKYPYRGTLCDLGAGQGRDSIALHEMGCDVTAVDISSLGLAQLNEVYPDVKTVKTDIDFFRFLRWILF